MGVADLQDLDKAKGVKLLHVNVRSLPNKIDQLRVQLSTTSLDVISVSETWAKKCLSSQLFQIQGYNIERQDRDLSKTTKKKGGGLVTYINATKFPDYLVLDKLSVSEPFLEALWVKIRRSHCKDLVICNLYRPPEGNLQKALNHLNASLHNLNMSKIDLYIMGDMTVDYLNKSSAPFKKLAFFERANNLRQIISEITRHTDRSRTLLDIILMNDRYVADQGTLNMMISDHQPIYVIKKKGREKHQSASFKWRPYGKLDLKKFRHRIAAINLDEVYYHEDPNKIWDIIIGHIQKDLDTHCSGISDQTGLITPYWIRSKTGTTITKRLKVQKM